MDNNCWIGIGNNFYPGNEIYEQLVAANAAITGNTMHFDTHRVPHLNFYDIQIPQKNTTKVKQIVDEIAVSIAPYDVIPVRFTAFSYGLIYLEIEKSPTLVQIEKLIVEKLEILRDGCIVQSYYDPKRKYTLEEKEHLDQYGNPFVLATFRPHISVGFIKDPSRLSVVCDQLNDKYTIQPIRINTLDLVIEQEEQKVFEHIAFPIK